MTRKSAKRGHDSASRDELGSVTEALSRTGFRRPVARVLAFLSISEEWATSKDIERGTRLRQPEVSTAVRSLIDKKWVESDSLQQGAKGRPVCIYRMAVDLGEVYKAIEAEEQEKISAVESNLGRIKKAWQLS